MKKAITFFILAAMLCWLANCKSPAISKSPADPFASERARYVAQVNEMIKGKEHVSVDSVFVNLEVLGGFPAENLVFAMDKWAQALGVSCTHCHDPGDWVSDAKPQKNIARQMVNLGELVNSELRKIKGLKSERPTVNCISCHRGHLKPALRLGS